MEKNSPLWIGVLCAGVLTLLTVAFLTGYQVANNRRDVVINPSAPALPEGNNFEVVPVPDGKSDGPAPVPVPDTSSVPSAEQIMMDGIGWYPSERQVSFEMNELWRSALLSTTAGQEFLKKYALSLIDTTTTRLGLVNDGFYKGYELQEQYFYAGELGGERIKFYTLAQLNDRGEVERFGGGKELYIVGSQLREDWMKGALRSVVFSESELRALSGKGQYTWLTMIDDTAISELMWGEDSIEVNGITFHYVHHRQESRGATDKASIVIGRMMDGHELRQEANAVDAGLFVRRFDGYKQWYEISTPFWTAEEATVQTGVPSITVNGQPVTNKYMKSAITGCGFTGAAQLVKEADIPGKKEIGYATLAPDQKIYGANFMDIKFDEDYANWKRLRPAAEATREKFANSLPAFYFKDALGRWLKYGSVDISPGAECGKPVIYLYPEEKTDLTVKLAPQGGFSVTEPAYGTGWNVTASPDGTLVNRADGKTYPYLFWEGRGGRYESPKQYWVVAKADVEPFLKKTLAAFGFNEKEVADFNEFWLPRMQSAPYYKVGFHGTDVMDAIAPMSISQKPDSVLRILMDYEPLTERIAENPPRLPSPLIRQGFTVVEWGGVLR